MRIANPLYDYAFKYLMSNERLARKVLSVILDKEVLALALSQQEIVMEDEERQFNLADIPLMAVRVDQRITDLSSQQLVELESDFISLLTHDCYILQVRRLPPQRRSRIERFMTLFNQAWVREANYILDLEEVPEEFKDIAEYLQAPLLNEEMRRKLQTEQEMEDYLVDQETRIKLLEEQKEIAEAQVEEERQQKEAAQVQAEAARQSKEKAEQDLIKMVELLLQSGKTLEDIAAWTGRTVEELKRLIG